MTVHLETPAATGGREHPEQPVPAIGDRFAAPGALRFDPGAGEDWPDRVLVRLAAGQTAWCVAPFRGDAPVSWIGTAATATEAPGPALRPQHHRLRFDPDPGRYADTVRRAGVAIAAGTLKKVVLGRWATVHTDPPLSADQLTRRLRQLHPDATVFSVPLAEGAGAPVLLGASPELLISRRGRSIASTPLAGTVPRHPDPVLDRAAGDHLLASAKNRAEHDFVVRHIVERLRPLCSRLQVPEPRLLATDTVWHLATPITGRLRGDHEPASVLHLARLLHPTPAIAGVPTEAALRLIGELEDADRGPFTGFVGWMDADGDGEVAVTIRAGVLDGDALRLYAGAGIVAGSDADAEVAETAAKLDTVLTAAGVR